MAVARTKGELVTWRDDRGFGFIRPDGAVENLFVHISAFPPGADRPVIGDLLTFEVSARNDGTPQARQVHPADWSATRAAGASGRLDYLVILAFLPLAALAVLHWTAPWLVVAVYAAASILSFLMYRTDKRAAGNGGWRIPEGSLLLIGVAGGWPGSIIAMRRYRHKTRKIEFRRLFWATVFVNILAFAFITSPLFSTLLAAVFGLVQLPR